MAPYDPPNCHYTELDVSSFDPEKIFRFVGQNGKRFYWLTHITNTEYIWFNKERKVIEIWGSWESLHLGQAKNIVECELKFWLNNNLSSQNEDESIISENDNSEASERSCSRSWMPEQTSTNTEGVVSG
jgi:hypothetical protein